VFNTLKGSTDSILPQISMRFILTLTLHCAKKWLPQLLCLPAATRPTTR
jgi:hypothetical protein